MDPDSGVSAETANEGSLDSVASAFSIISKQRKQLTELLQEDLELVLDELLVQDVITEEEYETLDKTEEESKKKSRKLLIMIQKKGEKACFQFLELLEMARPGSRRFLQQSREGCQNEEGHAWSLVDLAKTLEESVTGNTNVAVSPVPKEMEYPEDDLYCEEKCPFEKVESKYEETASDELLLSNDKISAKNVIPKEENFKERSEALEDILLELKLLQRKSKKITLHETLEISSGSLKKCTPHSLEELPWHFLRKVLALNVSARNTNLDQGTAGGKGVRGMEKKQSIDDRIFIAEMDTKLSMNPLDVLCALLLCSDSFLQQDILSKMSMCQFALPLLLPPLGTPKCTLMIWAMRDIVKKWRPHSLAGSKGFREENLVLIPMPIISFVRLGSSNISKSQLLNDLLSSSQQHHDFFIHRDMKGGNVPRKISDGLIEITWYFPGGQENSDLFSDPVAFTNLRGDIEPHWMQLTFLAEVSSALFIVAKFISEREYNLLSLLKESSTQYYFILECDGSISKETFAFLNKLAPVLKFDNSHILPKAARSNKAEFVEKLQSTLERVVHSSSKNINVRNMADIAGEFDIWVDEHSQDCLRARRCAKQITQEIKDVTDYKKEELKLQGDLWKNLAVVEKELCRMEKQGAKPSEEYRSELIGRLLELREQQHKCELTVGLIHFIHGIKYLNPTAKHYFLKWMKFNLDSVARENLLRLRTTYKEKCRTVGNDGQVIVQVDRQIASSSLGVEHFMRELGQLYEAEYSVVQQSKLPESQRQFVHLPSIAATLMLEGFPIELIDGDASNIPVQWVTDVLTELNKKLNGQSKMIVVTVLGVQSTGKSTLLNTMFGLQFPVSSGRCTRGAFMTFLKVKEDMAEDLHCDFLLVIDTEGLKAPELAQLEESYHHDNELATLVIGLSDITIVNMAMENATEMKDVLQIVTHAFLRMKEIGLKPNCQFVHQNVSDVSAHDQNMMDRKRLLEQLDEMTQAAAKMEKVDRNTKFSDIIDYDPEMNSWYIPGLWHGVPPMAPVNAGYSEKVLELKQHLIEFIKNRSHQRSCKDIPAFIEWLKSLWSAVKQENFIFSFRNSLIAEAYNNLSVAYSEWDWSCRKEMYFWLSEHENEIYNIFPQMELYELKSELQDKLSIEKDKILKNLDEYFQSEAQNLHLVERYKEDFVRNANSLMNELGSSLCKKLEDAIKIKKGQHKIEALQNEYLKTIERKVDHLLEQCRKKEHVVEEQELKKEFEQVWRETLSELSPVHLIEFDIYADVEFHLRKNVESQSKLITQKLQKRGLSSYRVNDFQINDDHMQSKWLKPHNPNSEEYLLRIQEFSISLIYKCISYMDEKIYSKRDYVSTYCGELLHLISENFQEDDVQKLHMTPAFEADLKLHILGEAAYKFQKMHKDFIEENDPRKRLDKLKPHYFSIFKDLYQKKDAQQIRAKDFCDRCLHPALEDYINKRLGIEIVDHFRNSEHPMECSSRNFLQFTLLKELLDEWDFDQYVECIRNYEQFVKNWIQKQVIDCYIKNDTLKNLEKDILSGILTKVKNTVDILRNKNVETFSNFVDDFCQELQKDLAISKSNLVGLELRSAFDPDHFSAYVDNCLQDLQKEILSKFESLDIESKLSRLSVKPQDEIFKQVFGCGKQCPFCKVPCEAGGAVHKDHFAAVHRPGGLGEYRDNDTWRLISDICSSQVASQKNFKCADTNWEFYPYKDYRDYYPNWCIQPDPSLNASDYWKFVLKEFNTEFSKKYSAKRAHLPKDWKKITKEQALQALKQSYNMNRQPNSEKTSI
ncbi:interferon-induced very large GTPase 1-like [Anolis sagrei]|uniref:interferon-induced very large GTPase 1-like n=1 Tax=Anolis sagrei TaxID=38937 RepID=UPI00351FA31C